jgi:hypothetical protein
LKITNHLLIEFNDNIVFEKGNTIFIFIYIIDEEMDEEDAVMFNKRLIKTFD